MTLLCSDWVGNACISQAKMVHYYGKYTAGERRKAIMAPKKKRQGTCEQCNNYVYDEDYECYACEMDLDEDEMAKFLADEFRDCPYYQPGDEYLVVRKQM